MTLSVFDQLTGQAYDEACDRGLRLAGEPATYFARRRVEATRALCGTIEVRAIVDFGCGPGHTTPHLLAAFPAAAVVGVDRSATMIAAARQRYAGPRAEFRHDLPAGHPAVDLVYCNGVFHHIPPAGRLTALDALTGRLRVGGLFALWENNPWNPFTRLVMSRIPFDRDAAVLSSRDARELAAAARLTVVSTTFCFFFPAMLRVLRSVEPALQRVPLGGQYCVLGRRAS